jgi:hypothetical protein
MGSLEIVIRGLTAVIGRSYPNRQARSSMRMLAPVVVLSERGTAPAGAPAARPRSAIETA